VERFDIYLRGFFGSGSAELGLQRAFGIDAKRAAELVRSLPRVVKREVPGEQAARYEQALTALGADFELRRSPIRPQRMITVSGGAPAIDELDLPGPAWPPPAAQPVAALSVSDGWSVPANPWARPAVSAPPPAPPAMSAAMSTAIEASDARSLGSTWTESTPQAPALADTLVEARAAPRARPIADSRPLSATLPESRPPPPPPAAEALPWAHPRELAQLPALGSGPTAAQPPPLIDAVPSSAWASIPVAASAPLVEAAPSHAWAPIPAGEPPPQIAPSSAWAPIPAAELAAGAVAVGPPAAWQASALDVKLELRGQPGWLLENSNYDADGGTAAHDPFEPPPSDPPRGSAPGAGQASGFALHSARPARAANPAQAPARPAPAVGLIAGRELDRDEASPLLHWILRVGIGLSLFVIVTTARHCRSFETGVDDALARWNQRGAHHGARAAAGEASGAHGPSALAWLEPDLHLVSSGDKDRVRSLARRFEAAGAAGVFVGTISTMGMTKVAGELIVQLPADPAARKAVLDVYDQFLAASFGGVAVAGAEPQGDVLRITL
jgi:hypothetical protein